MLLMLILCSLSVAQAQSDDNETRLVHTTQGPVRGYREGELFVFYSIPYATAPTGVNKFKAPLEAAVWKEPFEAGNKSILCPQSYPGIDFKIGEEDCLVATVYISDTNYTNLPVVVYVHGGGNPVAFGNQWPPRTLVKSKRIVAVTFNYRLAVHGFLCLGTENIPGNAAMKDQVALLRWVNKNIANFGGNPDDVTIAGYSAGATSVDLLMLSKTTGGLFNKVIPESGANVATWAVQQNPLENAKEFAKLNGFTNVNDISALEGFFLSASWDVLLNLDDYFFRTDSTIGFSSCVENDLGEEIFLDDNPVNILKEGNYNKVPVLYGFAEMEGLLRVEGGLFYIWKDKMNEKFSNFLPADLQFENEEQKEEVAKEIKQFYFGSNQVSEDTILAYVDYFTDVMFAYPMLRSVKLQVEAGNEEIYLYEYSFLADERPSALESMDLRGAGHVDQTWAILDAVPDQSSLSERTQNMQIKMRHLWLNFITTGAPVPSGSELQTWPAVGAERSPHMSLNETSELRESLLQQRAQFWDDIYERYYRAPVSPSSVALAYFHPLLILLMLIIFVI